MGPKRKAAKAAPVEDLTKLTVPALRKKCKAAGLDDAGKKADLILRLQSKLVPRLAVWEKDWMEDGEGPPAKLAKQSTIQKAMVTMEAAAKKEAATLAKNRSYKVDEHYGGIGSPKVEPWGMIGHGSC